VTPAHFGEQVSEQLVREKLPEGAKRAECLQ
jgi:acetyl-CoA carboxylase beta subunit